MSIEEDGTTVPGLCCMEDLCSIALQVFDVYR